MVNCMVSGRRMKSRVAGDAEGDGLNLAEQLPRSIQMFLAFEQQNLWRPERWRNSSVKDQLDRRYLPESGAIFRLPCFWVERKYLYVYGEYERTSTELGIEGGDGPESRVLFPIHPAELPLYADFLRQVRALDTRASGVRLWATPTSSARTVLAWVDGRPESPILAKLSLRSGPFGDRRIQRGRVARSVGLWRLMQGVGGGVPAGIRWFPENLGLVPRMVPSAGVIVRSFPAEIKDGKVIAAALFALMGGSARRSPLLIEMFGSDPRLAWEFIEEVLLMQFAGIWLDLVFRLGVILEAHGQDLLLGLSPAKAKTGLLYYRDFEGLAVDWELRRAKGLAGVCSLPNVCEWYRTYETLGYPLHQLVFWKIRTSLFDYVFLVLAELESALGEWCAGGVLTMTKPWELTLLFSRHMRRAIQDRFGMNENQDYDIRKDLTRFVKFLMRVRAEVVRASSASR